jgi:nucleoside 2-deoxyribosyltransferase/Zn ribbon nucleic-acid-binding protein
MANIICPVCKKQGTVAAIEPGGRDISIVHCKNCGDFEISRTAHVVLTHKSANPKLSYSLRKRSENGSKNQINTVNIDEIINSVKYPETIPEKVNEIVSYLYKNQNSGGYAVSDKEGYIFGIKDNDELELVMKYAEGKGLLTIHPKFASGGGLFSLMADGIDLAEDLLKRNSVGSQAFVAMWFDDSMEDAFSQGIEPALKETGYKVIRIDKKEFLGDINEEIQKEIKQSKILIADYTGNRGGVYYEAGYAKALNKPVVCCCKEDYLKELHFDVKHLNQIVWSSPADLKEKLINRISGCGLSIE